MKDKISEIKEGDGMNIFAVTSDGVVTDVIKAVRSNIPNSGVEVQSQGFSYISPPYNMSYLKDLHDFNSTHKFCIFLKVNLTCGLGYNLREKVPKGAIKFLKNPNNNVSETWTKLCKKLKLDEEIYGRFALEVVSLNGNVAFYHVPADEVLVVQKGKTLQVSEYLQKTSSGFKKFQPYTYEHGDGRFLFVSDNYSPISRFYGVPNYVTAIKAIIGNDIISNYMLNFFSNNARPDYFIIVTGTTLTKEQKLSIEQNLKSIKGVENAHRLVTLALGNADARVEVKEMSKIVDENFRNTKLDNRDEIAQIHGVPPKILGISSAGSLGSGNEAIGALKILVECVIHPSKIEFEEQLNLIMQNEFKFDKPIFSFKEITLVNEKDLAIIHKTYIEEGIMSVNEIRDELGKKRLEGKRYDEVKPLEVRSKTLDIQNDDMTNIDPTKDISQTNV